MAETGKGDCLILIENQSGDGSVALGMLPQGGAITPSSPPLSLSLSLSLTLSLSLSLALI